MDIAQSLVEQHNTVDQKVDFMFNFDIKYRMVDEPLEREDGSWPNSHVDESLFSNEVTWP